MNIEEMIMNGASEEEINEALNQIKAEKARQEAAKAQAQKNSNEKESLKAEGRAHLINALICYSHAFDLLDEGEEWDQEDVDKTEEAIKKLEDMIPLYIKIIKMQEDMDKDLGFGFGLAGGLF
jgi:hypothetical protein